MMKLYFKAGACSLAPHIVIHELGLPYEAVPVDLATKRTKAGDDFTAINPKGYVPAIALDDGTVLSECGAVLQYLADRKPAAGLAPANGTLERYQLQEWLAYISTELHKTFGALFNPAAPDFTKEAALKLFGRRVQYVEDRLAGRDYLMGAQFTAADAYLYTVLGWTKYFDVDLGQWPRVKAYHARVAARPAVIATHATEAAA
jgi:glutathione S-transferase